MKINLPELVPATFIRRLHRFGALVHLEGEDVLAHLANPGRMRELLLPGVRVWVEKLRGKKCRCRLWLVEKDRRLVCINSLAANRLAKALLSQGYWPDPHGPFPNGMYKEIHSEARMGNSRFDFLLNGDNGECVIETKSVTLVEHRVALFPDAPTSRGARHLLELARLKSLGLRFVVLFIVQRDDAVLLCPNRPMDPVFADAMVQAVKAGVEAYALTCRVMPTALEIIREIPVGLG